MSGPINSPSPSRPDISWSDAFRALSPGFQALTVVTVIFVSIFTLGAASVAVFRALVNAFSKLNLQGDAPHEKTGQKADSIAQNALGPKKPEEKSDQALLPKESQATPLPQIQPEFNRKAYIQSLKRQPKENLGDRSKFMRAYLAHELGKANKKFLETKDDGDCFWDAVAQQLSILEARPVTVKEVRMKCHDYLQELELGAPEENWVKKALVKSFDETYASFLQNIQFTTEERFPSPPVWGDHIAAMIVSKVYDVRIQSYFVNMYEFEVECPDPDFEEEEETEYQKALKEKRVFRTFTQTFKEIVTEAEYDDIQDEFYEVQKKVKVEKQFAEAVTIFDMDDPSTIDMRKDKTSTQRTLHLANYQAGPTGHVLAVVDIEF